MLVLNSNIPPDVEAKISYIGPNRERRIELEHVPTGVSVLGSDMQDLLNELMEKISNMADKEPTGWSTLDKYPKSSSEDFANYFSMKFELSDLRVRYNGIACELMHCPTGIFVRCSKYRTKRTNFQHAVGMLLEKLGSWSHNNRPGWHNAKPGDKIWIVKNNENTGDPGMEEAHILAMRDVKGSSLMWIATEHQLSRHCDFTAICIEEYEYGGLSDGRQICFSEESAKSALAIFAKSRSNYLKSRLQQIECDKEDMEKKIKELEALHGDG